MHRLRLTHGPQAIPKLARESTDQFLAKASGPITRKRKSTVQRTSKLDFRQPREPRAPPPSAVEQRRNVATDPFRPPTARSKSNVEVSRTILPPITRRASQEKPALPLASVSALSYSTVLPSLDTSAGPLFQRSSPSPVPPPGHATRSEPVSVLSKARHDSDLFRRAYERALSVARSRRLLRDPYSLLGPRATHSVFYSYYDHTPMCVFSRGSTCDHPKNSPTHDRRSLSELTRREIFDHIVVEEYLQ